MKKSILKTFLIFCCFYIILFTTFSIEVTDGKLKLILHEDIGRFSLYYLLDAENSKYLPLFTDQDPRTTTFSILVDNKVYRLGDSFTFKETVEKTTNGAKFIWKSNQLEVTEEFAFIKSLTSTESDGIKITLSFTNLSETELNLGARYIIDTNLGESDSTHFKKNSGAKITKETKVESSEMIEYWVSPKDDTTGLMGVTSGNGITTPDVVIFANWKRLNDTSWSYSTSSARNFNLPPYSINDSAVCQYYLPQKLASGLSMEIVMVLGHYSESGFIITKTPTTIKSSDKTSAKIPENTAVNPAPTDSNVKSDLSQGNPSTSNNDTLAIVSLKGDISTIEAVLEEINLKITNGNYTEKDIELLEKIITELTNKAKNYSQN